MQYDNEVPKHIKKRNSSVSKSRNKSKHRHEYIDCLLMDEERKPHKATHCKICGKVGKVKLYESEKVDHGIYRILSAEEIFKKYKNLPLIQVESIFQKYIPLKVEE